MFSGIALKTLISLVFLFVCNILFTCVVEYASSNCFIERFRAAVSVLVGPCCPALINCIDVECIPLYYRANKMMTDHGDYRHRDTAPGCWKKTGDLRLTGIPSPEAVTTSKKRLLNATETKSEHYERRVC